MNEELKITDLPHAYGQSGWQYSAKKVTVKYRDSQGNVRCIYEQCAHDNNRLLKSGYTVTNQFVQSLGRVQTQEWMDVCHKRDIISIHKGKN